MSNNNTTRSLVLAFLVVMSVFAGAFAFAGGAAATHADSTDEEIVDGENYWDGQNLLYNHGTAEEEKLTLYEEDGTFVREMKTDADGHYVLDTSDMDGSYYIEDTAGTQTAFDVRTQTFTAELGSDTVANGDTGNTVELNGDSNRAASNVTVSAEGLTADELAGIVANYGVEGTDYTVDAENDEVTLVDYSNSNNAFNLNFTGVDADEYDLQFNVADTDASDNASVTVNEASSATAQFDEVIYAEERGDIVEFTVELENTDTADVQIGDSDAGYEAVISVTDGNDDGEVTVQFNSYEAGNGQVAFEAADSEDDVTLQSGDNLDVDKLQAGSYDLSALVSGDETGVAAFDLNERSTDGASVLTAPKGTDLSNLEALNAATESNEIAQEDMFVVQIEASGLAGWVDDTTTAADLAAGHDGASVEITQQNAERNSQKKSLDVSQGTLVADGDNDTYYLVFNTADVNVAPEDGAYDATFQINADNDYVAEDETEEAAASLSFVERNVEFDGVESLEDGDVINFEADNDGVITVSGDATVAPGTEFNLRLRSSGDSTPFLKGQTVAVQEDGTFAADFDMSDVEDGDEFTTQARGYTDAIDSSVAFGAAEYDVTVNAESDGEAVDDATVSIGNQTGVAGDTFTLEEGDYPVDVEADGYEAATETIIVDGDKTVTVELTPEPETHAVTVNVDGPESAQVTLNGETQTTEDGAAVFEVENGDYTATVSADGYESGSSDVTVDGADASATVTLEEEQTDDGTEEPSPTDEETPGFGAVVALIALIGAALLAYRRN